MNKPNKLMTVGAFSLLAFFISLESEAAIVVERTQAKVEKIQPADSAWSKVKAAVVPLMGQPMAVPMPKGTNTSSVSVQALHDGEWVAFRLRWKDSEKSSPQKLGEFSDAVAIQFPVKEGPPPIVFMGSKEQPVHIYHWRAQYQADRERGRLMTPKDMYPNMSVDAYPMEFDDPGTVKGLTQEKRDVYAHGRAAGNPQSYLKTGVDEILAEGFGSSAAVEGGVAQGTGKWEKGEWTVVITRPMKNGDGSKFSPGQPTVAAFAVWQGGKGEVGSRKSVTMSWVPVEVRP